MAVSTHIPSRPWSMAVVPSAIGAVPPLGRASAIRAWRVLHACEQARDVLGVIEIQSAAGMRPWLVTSPAAGFRSPGGHGRRPGAASLLTCWNEVRQWRRAILEADPRWQGDMIHAHSFAAGMAAVRTYPAVVYDVVGFVEELAIAAGQIEAQSWLARSFRVAEQFVLARAGAVVVHTSAALNGALCRGTDPINVFLIDPLLPPALAAEEYDAVYDHADQRRRTTNTRQPGHGLQPVAACL